MDSKAATSPGELLRWYSDRGYDRAWSMPRDFYIDPTILALEKRQLFGQEWVCIGRVEELAKPDDYVTFKIADEPVVLVHGDDGRIRAFSNVCRHRGALLADGAGSKKRLVCPYHHWSYDQRGRLAGAPGMPERPDFDRANCRLPEFAVETWQGFVFVSLESDPQPLAARLAGLEDLVRPYHMEQMQLRYLADEVWNTNWKCLLENFMEGYHLTPLHRETLHPVNPTRLCSHFPPGEAYFGYNAGFSPTLPRSQKGHPDLSNAEIDNCVMYAVPPGLVVGCAGDYSSFLCLQPHAIDQVRVKMGLIFYGPDWPQDKVDWAVDLFQRTMAEDKTVLVSLMTGLRSSFHQAGPLAPADLEGPTWDFYKYLHRKLGAALAAARPLD
jgi:nitrite reductase/ring-hydroxylating ferredoxin subunit